MTDNELIAEFMGVQPDHKELYQMDMESFEMIQTYQEEDDYLTIEAGLQRIKFTPEQMKYHTSWDWLMPVVEKINNLLSKNRVEFGYMDECLQSDDIETRYIAVVEFIKWYNENK